VKSNFLSDFRLEALLSAFCEHEVQSFTVARWTDFLPYNKYKKNVCKILNFLDKKPFNAIHAVKIDHSEHNQKNNMLMLNGEYF
jgi:hypothetical protein